MNLLSSLLGKQLLAQRRRDYTKSQRKLDMMERAGKVSQVAHEWPRKKLRASETHVPNPTSASFLFSLVPLPEPSVTALLITGWNGRICKAIAARRHEAVCGCLMETKSHVVQWDLLPSGNGQSSPFQFSWFLVFQFSYLHFCIDLWFIFIFLNPHENSPAFWCKFLLLLVWSFD